MSDQNKENPEENVITPDDDVVVETGLDDVTIDETLDELEEAQPDPADVIVALNEENTELKNKAMALLADMENLRRRTEREVKDARQFAITSFARDMLSVNDNLTRAVDAVSPEAREAADDTLKNLLEGVEMTARDLINQLSKNSVAQLMPEGEKFDPNFHQAMFEVPDESIPNGTVVQVVQAGYKIGDRVLRPAMVGVSKGGPKVVVSDEEPGAAVDKSV